MSPTSIRDGSSTPQALRPVDGSFVCPRVLAGCVAAALLLLVPVSVGFAESESHLFNQAESRYAQGHYLLALSLYERFTLNYPLSDLVPDAQYRRAVSLYRLKRYDQALQAFATVAKRYRSTRYLEYVPFWQGAALFHLGRYAQCVDTLSAFLASPAAEREAPQRRQALLFSGIAEVSLESFDSAERTLKRLLREETPGRESGGYAAVLYCYVLLHQAKYQELTDFVSALNVEDLSPDLRDRVLLYRAEARWELGEANEAEKDYGRLFDAAPEIASVAIRRLFLLAQKRNDVQSMADLMQRAELRFASSPKILTDMWIRLGVENYKRGNYELAKHFLTKVWNLRDRQQVDEVVPLYLAQMRIIGNDSAGAAGILEEYLSRSSTQPPAVLMRLADVYLSMGDFDKAAGLYGQFAEKFPHDARAYEAVYLQAYSNYRLGRFQQALDQAEGLLKTSSEQKLFRRDLLRLRILLLQHLNRSAEAAERLQEYTRRYPADVRSRLDLLKVLFSLKRYDRVIDAAAALLQEFPSLRGDDPYVYLLTRYLQGLSMIARKDYAGAAAALAAVDREQARRHDLVSILPYTAFYQGWALYRRRDYPAAREQFLLVVRDYEKHELFSRALYMVAWSSFSMGDFSAAARYFQRLSGLEVGPGMNAEALFFEAKSLGNQGKPEEAAKVFEECHARYPDSPFADDALFEHAAVLVKTGRVEQGAEEYLTLFHRYPHSGLAEEALYRRADAYMVAGFYESARDAFYDFRTAFPRSPLFDAALYWGGLASLNAGEPFGAALLWERIIKDFPTSSFRPEAIHRTAEIYASAGDYARALNLYRRLVLDHPKAAAAVDAEKRIDELRLMKEGMSDREAELSVIIGREKGADTAKGRRAMIELAKIYIYGGSGKIDLAYQMLHEVISAGDPPSAAMAQFLTGEYFYRKDDVVRAGEEFLKAALVDPSNRDLSAAALYRAAEMMKLAGRQADVAALVKRLRENFAGSQWAEQAGDLLKGGAP